MSTSPSTIRHILVGFDGSPSALAAVGWAAAFADRVAGELTLVRSLRESLGATAAAEEGGDPGSVRAWAEGELERTRAGIAAEHPSVAVLGRVEVGGAADVLLDADADLLVVGHRGRGGFAELLLGSTARKVAARSDRTVVVVRGAEDPDGAVVVGIDGSDASRQALAWAADEARRRGAKLHVVLAWSYLLPEGEHGAMPFTVDYTSDEAERVLAAICSDVLGDSPDLDVRREATCELAAKALIERSEGAALLVVGPRRSSLRHLMDLGSVTAQLLHHAPCPLAIVRDRAEAKPA